MIAEEFVNKWLNLQNTDFSKRVGISVNWPAIKSESPVLNFYGQEGWKKVYDFTPPWYEKTERSSFKDLILGRSNNYLGEIEMEKKKKENNKFEFVKKHGLIYPLEPKFLAFSDGSGLRGVLGDGCHRFLVANYLINDENFNLVSDLDKTELDIICLDNFEQVIPFDPF